MKTLSLFPSPVCCANGRSWFSQEHGLLISTLLCVLVFPWFVRHIDITSAPVDPGILSVILVAILAFLSFKALTWWLIRIIWPGLAEYSELQFLKNFRSLHALQKVLIYLGFYLLLLFGLIATLAALA
ncbi:hypothetical protein [Arcticibacter sp. MXS-1]|uniref:hypothetical protein n=1 Tax=Arcticibacter sp. MXS-1 TaxID=3341726 RepID=UPI0035A8F27C